MRLFRKTGLTKRKQGDSNALGDGFTLIEAVVAVSVFAVAVTAIVGSLLAVLRINEKSRAIRVVEQNARFLSEFIAREVRNGSLNYAAYGGGLSQPESVLHLINSNNEAESIYLSGSTLYLNKSGVGAAPLTSADVVVSNLNFYIYPLSDPFQVGGPNAQPRVTFTFKLTSNLSIRPTDQASINVQSTVVPRDYPQSN